MKFGMPTMIEYNTIEENVKLAKSLNLSFVELNLDLPYCKLTDDIKNIAEKYNIEFTVHLSEKLDVGDLDDDIRNAYLKKIETIIKNGIKQNIRKYNLHLDPGIHFSLPDKKIFIYEKYLDEYKSNLKDSCIYLNNLAKKYDVKIMFENLKLPNYLKEGFEIVSSFDKLFFTLDMGHDLKNNSNAEELFLNYNKKINHVHLHDYNGKSDHIALGSGIMNIEEKLSLIKELDVYTVIEVKEKKELIDSIKFLNNLKKSYSKKIIKRK